MASITESLQNYVGGQIEVQNAQEGYLYRGEIGSIQVEHPALMIHLVWMVQGEGFPPLPLRWLKSPRKTFEADLRLYVGVNIGPGSEGSDRLCLRSLDGNETVVLYPPDGSKLSEPV